MRGRLIKAVAAANVGTFALGMTALGLAPTRSLAAADGSMRLRPNIVVFMTDDQTVDDMRVLAKTREHLSQRGVTFSNAFVSFPLCCPARATYLSGRYAHNHGVIFNDPPFGYQAARGTEILPGRLQQHGYRTIHVGKYFNGFGDEDPTEVPTGWSRFHSSVGEGIHWYHGYRMNHNGVVKKHGDPSIADPKTYLTDVMRKIAIDEIDDALLDEEPFFLSMAFLAPHGEDPYPGQRRPEDNPRGAPRHQDLYPTATSPRDAAYNESVTSDKPKPIRKLPPLGSWGKRFIEQLHRARWRSLRSVDDTVAKVVRRLDASGELEHTWFIFTSDNGFFSGEHRLRYGKYLPYEPSIRVPLVIAGPGLEGAESQQLVSNVDLAPTILDLAGIGSQAADMDGRSLVPALRRPADPQERILLLESAPSPDSGKDLDTIRSVLAEEKEITQLYQGVRTSRYKYIEYHSGDIELYDLFLDPYERRSLHADPFYAGLIPMMRAALELMRDCEAEACRTAETQSLGVSLG